MEAEIPRSTILKLNCLRVRTLVYDSGQQSIGVGRLIPTNAVGFMQFGMTLHQVSFTPPASQNCKILLSIWLQHNVVLHSATRKFLLYLAAANHFIMPPRLCHQFLVAPKETLTIFIPYRKFVDNSYPIPWTHSYRITKQTTQQQQK